MDPHVRLVVPQLGEAPPTLVTAVWFLSGVDTQVYPVAALVAEALVTLVALVGFLPGVVPQVQAEVA